jgi:hypothetical protein
MRLLHTMSIHNRLFPPVYWKASGCHDETSLELLHIISPPCFPSPRSEIPTIIFIRLRPSFVLHALATITLTLAVYSCSSLQSVDAIVLLHISFSCLFLPRCYIRHPRFCHNRCRFSHDRHVNVGSLYGRVSAVQETYRLPAEEGGAV